MNGFGGSAQGARAAFGWDQLGDREGVVVAYPEAIDGRWNAGICCRAGDQVKVDDVGFLASLRQILIDKDGVDPKRVIAVGFSNGGLLAYDWACSRPGDLAGIGVVSGSLAVRCPNPAPLSVVAIHGTADPMMPIGGGAAAMPGRYLSLDSSLLPFRIAAGCPIEPASDTIDGPVNVARWSCPRHREVVRVVIAGGGHKWPGAVGTTDASATRWDATGFLWDELGGARQ